MSGHVADRELWRAIAAGLGHDPATDEQWRQAWAHSGYAIDPICGTLLSVTGDNDDDHPSASLDALVVRSAVYLTPAYGHPHFPERAIPSARPVAVATLVVEHAPLCSGRITYRPAPVNSSLSCHSRRAAASSRDAGDDATCFCLAKYLPVTPSTSGEVAR